MPKYHFLLGLEDLEDRDMSTCRFAIAYDGSAVADGRMSVKDLAPALLAVGELFDAANKVLNEDAAKVEAHVKATSEGSFEVALELVQTSLVDQVVSLFSGDKVTAILQMKEFIFGTDGLEGGGVLALIKWLRGKKASKIAHLDEGTIKVTAKDGTTVEYPLKVLRLYEDPKVRLAIKELIAVPLQKSGIDEFQVRNGDRVEASVRKEDSEHFDASFLFESEATAQVMDMQFNIVSLAFKEGNKWRLTDGHRDISATIEDQDFLSRIDAYEEAFTKGDTLSCRVRIEQSTVLNQLKTTYTVEKVLDHKTGTRQARLDFDTN